MSCNDISLIDVAKDCSAVISPIQHTHGKVTVIVLLKFCFKDVELSQLLAVTCRYGYSQITINSKQILLKQINMARALSLCGFPLRLGPLRLCLGIETEIQNLSFQVSFICVKVFLFPRGW